VLLRSVLISLLTIFATISLSAFATAEKHPELTKLVTSWLATPTMEYNGQTNFLVQLDPDDYEDFKGILAEMGVERDAAISVDISADEKKTNQQVTAFAERLWATAKRLGKDTTLGVIIIYNPFSNATHMGLSTYIQEDIKSGKLGSVAHLHPAQMLIINVDPLRNGKSKFDYNNPKIKALLDRMYFVRPSDSNPSLTSVGTTGPIFNNNCTGKLLPAGLHRPPNK